LPVAVAVVVQAQDLPPTKAALIGAVVAVAALDTTVAVAVVVVVRAVRDQAVQVARVVRVDKVIPVDRAVVVVREAVLVILLVAQTLALVAPAAAQDSTSLVIRL
jgi:hypothetical protein